MRSLLPALLLLNWVAACGNTEPVNIEAKHPRYAPGQVWTYRTRPSEAQSRLTILRVENAEPTGYIVHVRVDGVSIKNTSAPGGASRTIGHLPFAVAAIDASVVTMEKTTPVPDFREGYDQWRAAFDQKKAGVWTTSVAEAVTAMEAVMAGAK